MNHSVLEELLAVDALGGLDADGRAELERARIEHGRCERCALLETEFHEISGRLAFALDPVAGPDDPSSILEQAREPHRVIDIRRNRTGLRAVAAVVAAVALFFAGWALRGGGNAPSPRVVAFSGAGGALAAEFIPGESGVTLSGSGLAAPRPGRVYELWTFQGKTPTRAGCFTPTDGSVSLTLAGDASKADLMAVTVEPSTCPSTPTTSPILTAKV